MTSCIFCSVELKPEVVNHDTTALVNISMKITNVPALKCPDCEIHFFTDATTNQLNAICGSLSDEDIAEGSVDYPEFHF